MNFENSLLKSSISVKGPDTMMLIVDIYINMLSYSEIVHTYLPFVSCRLNILYSSHYACLHNYICLIIILCDDVDSNSKVFTMRNMPQFCFICVYFFICFIIMCNFNGWFWCSVSFGERNFYPCPSAGVHKDGRSVNTPVHGVLSYQEWLDRSR